MSIGQSVGKKGTGESWGIIIRDEGTVYRLDSGRIVKKSTQNTVWEVIPGSNSSSASSEKKILINESYGGFSLSKEAIRIYKERTGTSPGTSGSDLRTDPLMIAIVEELGSCDSLVVETITPGYEEFYTVEEYDGAESIRYNEQAYNLHQQLQTVKEIARNSSMSAEERLARILESL
jgi:hypothetical protein